MSSRRKHLTGGDTCSLQSPLPCQSIVKALGSRGSNIVEVEHPNGQKTLCFMPAKFNKKLWVKRGGYLIIEDSREEQAKVTGTIVSVLYDEHVRKLKNMPGVWPTEFMAEPAKCEVEDQELIGLEEPEAKAGGKVLEGGDYDDEDDDLPPLQPNNNRRVVYHEATDSDTESDG